MATPHTPSEAFTPTPSPAPTPTTETQPATQIPTTATLNTLPDEILELITSNIYHSALPTVILTSRKFHRIGTPILYRAIEYTDGRKQALYGLPKPWDKISGSPKQRTYIQDIGCLIRTIKKCEALRDMIAVLCLDWTSIHKDWEKHYDCSFLYKTLMPTLLPNIQYVHVTPYHYADKYLPQTTSFNLLRWGEHRWTRVSAPEIVLSSDDMYYIFTTPSLRTLSMKLLNDRFDDDTWDMTRKEMAGTSPVTTLSFLIIALHIDLLAGIDEMLSWPKALENLHIGYYPFDDEHSAASIETEQFFIRALKPQRESLRELFIQQDREYAKERMVPIGLHLPKFGNLRRLGLSRRSLLYSREDTEITGHGRGELLTQKDLWQIIPPRLEELQLELDVDFVWDGERIDYESSGPFADFAFENDELGYPNTHSPSAKGLELSGWLKGVIRRKDERFPNLFRVVLWHSKLEQKLRMRVVNVAMKDDDTAKYINDWLESLGLLALYGEKRVWLEWSTNHSWAPPLFNAVFESRYRRG